MGKVIYGVEELVGKTPLLCLKRIKEKEGLVASIYAKLESFNPAGSAKDRVALSIIEKAEKEGKLKPGSVLVEPTSGNTGIALAAIGAARGYRVIIVMPDCMSKERRQLIAAYGAELVLTEGREGMKGAMKKAEELQKQIPDVFVAGQFINEANPEAHYLTTGPEIYDALKEIDVFIAGVGTGGTITGVGKYLREQKKEIEIIAVEPEGSPFLSLGKAGKHRIEGIGAGFLPEVLNTGIYDKIITVKNEEAYKMIQKLARQEGILAGISSGAALFAACKLAGQECYAGKHIVALLPDTGERYLSTAAFEE